MYINKHMHFKSVKASEDGFISIIVTMIFMIVLTLIVLSFAQLARREQRAALDRQLSTQAFYAAESGENDIFAAIQRGDIDALNSPARTRCNDPWPVSALTGNPISINSNLDTSSATEFTCVLYNPRPDNFLFQDLSTDRFTTGRFGNTDITDFYISWKGTRSDNSDGFMPAINSKSFPPSDSWSSKTGMLRIMLVPLDNLNRTDLRNHAFNGFLYPNNNSSAGQVGPVNWASGVGNSGALVGGECNNGNDPYKCEVHISSVANAGSGFLVVIRSIYQHNDAQICINAPGCDQQILGGQVVIDVTGKAGDVLRRIQTRRNINSSIDNYLPLGLTSINSICKQIVLDPINSPFVTDASAPSCPSLP